MVRRSSLLWREERKERWPPQGGRCLSISIQEGAMRGLANGHRRRSAAEWRGIIERYRQSGLGINEFCAQEGLTVSTFELWYRRHRRAEHRTGQFVQVT